ncbi:unnamed protein product [Orchesella dallaii]|uniref:Death domain-containing protein n=1 Tax=Orchesella dallaii TaxID=48710 RepID=A0ABP1QCT0_9HEXA
MNLGSTLIIGDEPCTFNAVCETLINAKTATVILSKPMELARALEIPSDKLVEIREKQGHTSAPSLLFEILTSWKAQKSSCATLQAFVLVLESLQWNDCADELKKKFCQFESTTFEDSPISKPVLSQQVVSFTERSNNNLETLRSPLQVSHQINSTSILCKSPRSPSPTMTIYMDSTGTDTSSTSTPTKTPSKHRLSLLSPQVANRLARDSVRC